MILLSMDPLGYQAEPTYFKNTDITKRSPSSSSSFKNSAAAALSHDGHDGGTGCVASKVLMFNYLQDKTLRSAKRSCMRSLLTLPILKSGRVNIKGPLFTFRHATRPPTAAHRLAIRAKQPYGEQFRE